MIRILLVDDHAVVRTGYRQLLEREPDLCVIGEAECSSSACAVAAALAPDVVVMDICLGADSGLEALRRIRHRSPRIRILVFSMYDQPVHVMQALRAGAHGYLAKTSPAAEMVDAVRAVAAGRRHLGADLPVPSRPGPALVDDDDEQARFGRLTPREFEVMRMALRGDASAVIAGQLHLSPKTIANTMLLIRHKLGVDSNAKLLRMALRHKLMVQDPLVAARD